MLLQRAYRYEMDPNVTQRKLFAQHAGVARFAYNWGLARRIRYYRLFKKTVTGFTLLKHLNKRKLQKFPWMREVSTYAVQSAMADLDAAFANFFTNLKAGRKPGFPKFKEKGKNPDKFRLYGCIHIDASRVQLPRIGVVRLKEVSKVEGKIKSAAVRRVADRWYVSILTELDVPEPIPSQKPACGIDLGMSSDHCDSSFATIVSERLDGSLKIRKVRAPKPLARSLERLARAQKKLSRKQRGSNNKKKTAMRVARLYRRIGNVRADFLHKLSNDIAKNHGTIHVEDLNVKGMMGSNLARGLSDIGMAEFVRQLEYKAGDCGGKVEKADRFYPSSKLCSVCGHKTKTLPLSVRDWTCAACGAILNRDGNAATNLLRQTTPRTGGSDACGAAPDGGTVVIPVYELCRAETGRAVTPGDRCRRSRPHI